MVLDQDNFKVLNDTQGHLLGDPLLVEVAARLSNCVRAMDTVGRFGGAASRTIGTAEEHHGTASMGAVLFRGKAVSQDKFINSAASAMYVSKTFGRNQVLFLFRRILQTGLIWPALFSFGPQSKLSLIGFGFPPGSGAAGKEHFLV